MKFLCEHETHRLKWEQWQWKTVHCIPASSRKTRHVNIGKYECFQSLFSYPSKLKNGNTDERSKLELNTTQIIFFPAQLYENVKIKWLWLVWAHPSSTLLTPVGFHVWESLWQCPLFLCPFSHRLGVANMLLVAFALLHMWSPEESKRLLRLVRDAALWFHNKETTKAQHLLLCSKVITCC